jgi:hypothetical protein
MPAPRRHTTHTEVGNPFQVRHRAAAMFGRLVTLQAGSMCLAERALAQSNACEQLKSKLAARIDPSIRGHSLEIVPASTPVPSGAKVIGTCEGGARKVLFRRFGGSTESSAAASAETPAPAPAPPPAPTPKVVAVPIEKTPRPADLRAERASVPAPVPAPVPRPAPAVVVAAAPVPVPAPLPLSNSSAPASAAPISTKVAEKPAGAASTSAEIARPADIPEIKPADIPPDTPPAANESLTRRVSDFIAAKWRQLGPLQWQWLWALLALPFGAWLWAWMAHRRAYDEAGLPRGPKITI